MFYFCIDNVKQIVLYLVLSRANSSAAILNKFICYARRCVVGYESGADVQAEQAASGIKQHPRSGYLRLLAYAAAGVIILKDRVATVGLSYCLERKKHSVLQDNQKGGIL